MKTTGILRDRDDARDPSTRIERGFILELTSILPPLTALNSVLSLETDVRLLFRLTLREDARQRVELLLPFVVLCD